MDVARPRHTPPVIPLLLSLLRESQLVTRLGRATTGPILIPGPLLGKLLSLGVSAQQGVASWGLIGCLHLS